MSNLFVIEAPGKARALEELLASIGIEAKVQATKGHLFAMPKKLDPLGIDSAFREYERTLIDPEIGARVREMASQAQRIYVATDADQEGDVIAWDVASLISDIHPEPYRVRLKGMDEESVRQALDDVTLVNKRDAVPGRTRAVIDRMIGSVFSADGVAVGRVSTALLGLVKDNPPCISKLRMVAPSSDGGRPWTAETDVSAPIDRQTAEKLSKVTFPPLDVQRTAAKPYSKPPGNMGDIMVRAGDALDMSPKEASSSLQKLYEAGRMSYPRAGSRGISKSALQKVHKILLKSGYEFGADKVAPKKETDVHDAPYPIGGLDIAKDPVKQGHEEGLRTLVGRELVKSGQSHVVQLGVGETAGEHLRKIGFARAVCDHVAKLHWRREEGPRYPGQEAWPRSRIVDRRQDTVLLEAAVAHGLGRPSTWASQIEKFFERGLVDENFSLTRKGKFWAEHSPPILLDPRISAYIEDACEKSLAGMMDDPYREPWEILSERIVSVLPPELREPLVDAIAGERPRPLVDPTAMFRVEPEPAAAVTVDDILREAQEQSQDYEYGYAPAMPSLRDF